MIPASHLFTGFLAGRLLTLSERGRKLDNRLKTGVVLVAMAGSVAPDIDVIPGLVAGWGGAGWHRTATHSVLGSLLQALGLGAVAYIACRRRHFWFLFVAALTGTWTHILWDMLNTWGVQLFWPMGHGVSGNLVHEGDLFVLGALALASAVLLWGRTRLAFGTVVVLLSTYLLLSLTWQRQLASLADAELVGHQVEIFPTRTPWSPSILISRKEHQLEAHCLSTPWSQRLTRVRSVTAATGHFVESSRNLPVVREFCRDVWFPYPQTRSLPSGNVLVVWSDFRETFVEEDLSRFPGIHVTLGPAGEMLTVTHHWRLNFW